VPTPATDAVIDGGDSIVHDVERCYRAVQSRDARFDGWFVTAVRTTGIYCRPSCPATTPARRNLSFFATAAAAQQAGYRACKRCRPDASPGSPEWNVRADVVARAMRSIADGVLDREGVAGLARRLGYSERHLNRLVTDELGVGPLAIARAQRAQTARTLIETTTLPMTDVAFAAGFASIRQFNDTVREVFATTPSALRAARRRGADPATPGTVTLRLALRGPFDASSLFGFVGARAVPGVERWDGSTYHRTLRLAAGAATVALRPTGEAVSCTLQLDAVSDLQSAVQRCRRLLDLDADPLSIDEQLGRDELLAPLVAKRPGLRSPGAVDGGELLVRAVLGQQVSVAAARTIAGRLAARVGDTGRSPHLAAAGLVLFPSPAALAELDDADLPMPTSRRRTLRAACRALATGAISIDAGADRDALVHDLEALPGIGPWTSSYVAMRALGDPDRFMPTDLGVRRALERLGEAGDPRRAGELATRWRPWRSYALHHLWASLS